MAACGTLQHIFDNPCKHITPANSFNDPPIDMFSGFNLNQKPESILSLDHNPTSSSHALGSESFDDVKDFNDQWEERRENVMKKNKISSEAKRSRSKKREFPPPISSIGRRGCFKSYRCNGRLVLKDEKILKREILHVFREDGRLKLRFIQFDDGVEETNKDQQREIRLQ